MDRENRMVGSGKGGRGSVSCRSPSFYIHELHLPDPGYLLVKRLLFTGVSTRLPCTNPVVVTDHVTNCHLLSPSTVTRYEGRCTSLDQMSLSLPHLNVSFFVSVSTTVVNFWTKVKKNSGFGVETDKLEKNLSHSFILVKV